MKSTSFTHRALLRFALPALCLLLILPLRAQVVYVVNGSASSLGGDCFQITPAQNNQAGSVWSQNKISLASDFEIRADLNFGNKDTDGADGMAFVLQPVCTGLGSLGGGIGYQGIAPSLTVEYDTYQNANPNFDPAQDHMALQQNGNLVHTAPGLLAGPILLPNIENGAYHSTVINWNVGTQTLNVFFDGTLQLTYTGDIVTSIFGGSSEVFWGFTAATGALNNDHRVCVTQVDVTEVISYTVTDASCAENADGAIDFTAGAGFTFQWSNGAVTEDISNVLPDTYTLAVSDANGCTSTYTIEVGVAPDLILPTIICPAPTSVACGGDLTPDNTGMATGNDNCAGTVLTFSDSEIPASCSDGLITRTWTATDLAGNTASCIQNITVIGDDVPPVCLNCPGDITIACDETPEMPTLLVSDNCDPDPVISAISTTSQGSGDACSNYQYTISLVYFVTDACGNEQSYPQTITVVDETAPVLTCPEDAMVACNALNDPDATGMATALDNCDPVPAITWEDVVVSGDCNWECVIERTWKAADACGNVSTCVQTITSSVETILEEALSVDTDGDGQPNPLVLGVSRNKLTLLPGSGNCIIEWMPSVSDSATSLRTAQIVLDGSACSIAPNLINDDGKSRNPLLEASLILSLRLRLNPDFGNTLLSELDDCMFHPIVYQYMPPNPDVNDLMRLANLGLGNIIGPPHLKYLLQALRCINEPYSLCDPEEEGGMLRSLPSASIQALSGARPAPTDIQVFPNPATAVVFVDLREWLGQAATVQLMNAHGQVLQMQKLAEISDAPLQFDVATYPAGLYFLRLKTDNGAEQTTKFVIGSN